MYQEKVAACTHLLCDLCVLLTVPAEWLHTVRLLERGQLLHGLLDHGYLRLMVHQLVL